MSERSAHASGGAGDSSEVRSDDAIDPAEQAVYDYARKTNARKNFVVAVLALVIASMLGGYFLVEEIGRLKTPLTGPERELLEAEGFRLKAVRAPRKGQLEALGKKTPRVAVAPGVRIDALDRQLDKPAMDQVFDPNAGLEDWNRKKRKPPVKQRPVDFDTRAGATADGQKVAVANSYTVGGKGITGPAIAISPRDVVFAPEAEGIASFSLSDNKRIDFKTVGRFSGKSDRVDVLAASPDGRWMVAGLRSGRVKQFQLDSLGHFVEVTKLEQNHFSPVQHIVISSDSTMIATVDLGAMVAVWSVERGRLKWKKQMEQRPVGNAGQECLDLKFTADGQQVIAAFSGTDVTLQTADGQMSTRAVALRKSAVLSPADRITISCTETDISVYAFGDEEALWKKSIAKSMAPRVALLGRRGSGVFSNGGDLMIEFDLKTGEILGRHARPASGRGQLSRLVVSASGKFLLEGKERYANGRLRANRFRSFSKTQPPVVNLPPALPLPPRVVPELLGAKDGKHFRKLLRVSPDGIEGKISAVALNSDGLLFFATSSARLYVYDWANEILVEELVMEPRRAVTALATCGRWLAAGGQSGAVGLYEVLPSGKLKTLNGLFGHDSPVFAIDKLPAKPNPLAEAGQPRPCSIVSLSKDGNVRAWDIPSRAILLNVDTFGNPNRMVVRADRKIMVASTSHLATINADSKKVELQGSRRGGSMVALSPDGKKLAFVNHDKITIAKTKTGTVGKPAALEKPPIAIEFTRDSKFLQAVFPEHVAIVNFRSGKTVDVIDVEIRPHTGGQLPFVLSADQTLMAALAREKQQIIIVPVGNQQP